MTENKMGLKLLLIILSFTAVKSDISYVDLFQYENYTIPDLDTICSYFGNVSITEKCAEQLGIACRNVSLLMTFLDASSKFPYTGLGYSTRNDYGNFDQCLTVDHKYEGGRILGEHCTYGLVIPDISNITDQSKYYTLSVCRPNACSADDFNGILFDLLNISQDMQGLFVDGLCQTVDSNTTYTSTDIVTLTILGIIIMLMIVSTTYDIYLYKRELKCPNPLLIAFSVRTNGKKLFHISKHSSSKEQIEVFHGMRVISIMWVVAGHGLALWPYIAVSNADRVKNWESNMYAVYITSAHLAVDTFFFMSGVVVTFQYLKGKTKSFKAQAFSVPRMILHRYLRLTPAMLMVYLFTISVVIHIGSGPMWSGMYEAFAAPCRKNWWSFFLYIQNYYNYEEICIIPTWYLSADMQMFLITPLVLIPLSLHIKNWGINRAMVEMLVLNLFLLILPLVIQLLIHNYNEYDTHSRLINYFIGVSLGAFMRANIDKPFLHIVNDKHRGITNFVVWSVTLLGMLAIVLCYQEVDMNAGYDRTVIFTSLMRPAWCIGLCWITYSCYHGYGGFVNWVLCRPIFQVIGRLTYCIYLLHASVIGLYHGTMRTKLYFSDYNEAYNFCGHYVVTLMVAIFWTLAFESPLINIEKYIFNAGAKPRTEQTAPQKGDIEQQTPKSAHQQ